MSTNFAKTLVWKRGNDVKLWRHKQRKPNTNGHHMTLNQPPPMKIFCVRHWLPHKLCRFTPNLCNLHALLFQHLYSEFFQHTVWNGPTSKTVWMQRRQKNWKKYTDVTEVKKITSRIYSNCSNYSSLFFKSFKFRCCSFFFIEKCTLNCTSVLLILLLTS